METIKLPTLTSTLIPNTDLPPTEYIEIREFGKRRRAAGLSQILSGSNLS